MSQAPKQLLLSRINEQLGGDVRVRRDALAGGREIVEWEPPRQPSVGRAAHCIVLDRVTQPLDSKAAASQAVGLLRERRQKALRQLTGRDDATEENL